VGEKFSGPTATAYRLKIFTLNVTVSCRETCVRSERVNLYDRHMILPRKTKTYAMLSSLGTPSGMSGTGNLC